MKRKINNNPLRMCPPSPLVHCPIVSSHLKPCTARSTNLLYVGFNPNSVPWNSTNLSILKPTWSKSQTQFWARNITINNFAHFVDIQINYVSRENSIQRVHQLPCGLIGFSNPGRTEIYVPLVQSILPYFHYVDEHYIIFQTFNRHRRTPTD